MDTQETHDATALDAVLKDARRLMDEHRVDSLWFMRPDEVPRSVVQWMQVMAWIEQRGDRVAYKQARRIREWLSRVSKEPSAA